MIRRQSRDINIFNISMLDVICGALGVFLLIVIILLPYYNMRNIDHVRKLKELETQAKDEQDRFNQKIKELEGKLSETERRFSKTFLLVYIRWNTIDQDVDLHVIDPAGNEFYYKQKRFSHVDGELCEDSQIGPGNEVWEIKSATTGVYRLYANLYHPHGNFQQPVVRGRVFFRDGNLILPEVVLTHRNEKVLIANVKVDESGNVSLEGR